ncbi:MAG TPA: arginine--tRNA ligase, partial [Gammaproteobacteria bacterium]|nr:arginine--tRNA ligase [Gammaproteobacteria bacterium]
MKHQLRAILERAVQAVLANAGHAAVDLPAIQLDSPRNPEHGDFSTNIAMTLAPVLKVEPRSLAAEILTVLKYDALLERAEIAGPGFINLYIA